MSLWNQIFYASIGIALTPQVAAPLFLNFEKEDGAYIYHPQQNTWQGLFDYTNLYDSIANIFTDIDTRAYQFSVGTTDYSLRLWNGNYLNEGAGAEAALYYIDNARPNMVWNKIQASYPGDAWRDNTMWNRVPEDKWFNSEIELRYGSSTIFTYAPDDTQWWSGGFNPAYPGVRSEDLSATYTIGFSNNPELYASFQDKYEGKVIEKDISFSFDDDNNAITIWWRQ
jgi:hypothetical protein